MPTQGPRRVSALPSVRARVLAFAAIVVAGLCGGLIGSSFVNLQCHGDCTTPAGLGGIAGAAIAAGGVAVVAVLTLRAMGEWRRISDEQLLGEEATELSAGVGVESAEGEAEGSVESAEGEAEGSVESAEGEPAGDREPVSEAGGGNDPAGSGEPQDGYSSRKPSA